MTFIVPGIKIHTQSKLLKTTTTTIPTTTATETTKHREQEKRDVLLKQTQILMFIIYFCVYIKSETLIKPAKFQNMPIFFPLTTK